MQYGAGVETFRYREETLYEKTEETLPVHIASTNLGLRQPWGSVFLGNNGRQYLSDLSKYQATVFGETDLRIYKGLSLSLYSSYQLLRDQLYLPRGAATDEDLLLRRRQIATGFYYFGYMSLSYSFGSPFNNVVNPRFGGS
jgi:hypothetical protein